MSAATTLDLDRIRAADVRQQPYPFFVVEGALRADAADQVAADFPAIDRAGVVSSRDTTPGPAFARLLGLAERPSEQAMRERAEAWRPHRGAAAILAWHSYNSVGTAL